MSLFLNGVETNTLMWNGNETTGVWNGEVVWGVPQFKTLTLYHSEGGTLTANTLTGYPGDTINLSTAYNTYWRFSGYQWTGDGSLVGNTYTFGDEDASICACYKVNAFTASGGWEKGGNVGSKKPSDSTYYNVPAKYATVSYKTSNVPTAWYSTSNRWKPTNPSGYVITLKPVMGFSGNKPRDVSVTQATAVSLIGSTQTQSQSLSWGSNSWQLQKYSKSFTSNTVNVNYGLSARLYIGGSYRGGLWYIANQTTGTWTATGYAP